MEQERTFGLIVVLNGVPRSGKSSIVKVIQETFEGPWMNLGVDTFKERVAPERYCPGIGLRPGGEHPDLEPLIFAFYAAMYESIAAHSRLGLNVVTDVGHHDSYSSRLHILEDCARRLSGLPAYLVGVRCPSDVVMERRAASRWKTEGAESAVELWDREVHTPGIYDMEVDTSLLSPAQCADQIRLRLDEGTEPVAFHRLAADCGENDPDRRAL